MVATNTKCEACGRAIKRILHWDGRELGIECWKKIALPEIEKQRQARHDAREREEWERSYALVEAIKQKDFSKIKSEFKVKFLNSLIGQFEDKGFISRKQEALVRGDQFNGSMLNLQDGVNEMIALYLIGGENNKSASVGVAQAIYGCRPKLSQQYTEATGVKLEDWA